MTGGLAAAGTSFALLGAGHAVINAALLRRPDVDVPTRDLAPVSVLVPARDEEGNVTGCVAGIVGQPGVREVLVLDDCSLDATAERAGAAGARVITGTPPPPGWLGKPWACAQLAAAADPASQVLVFVDADVRLMPHAIARAVLLLETSGLDVICPFPRQDAGSFAERLVQPLLQWSWLSFLPLRLAERSPRPSLTAACGQFVVIRRSALARIGGHAAVRGEVLDDLALVRVVKAAGRRGGVVDGTELARCRMYRGCAELRAGYRKSLWAAFGSPAGAGGVLLGLGLAYVVPAAAAVRGSRVGALGYAAGVASRVVAARRTGGRAWPDALAHPVSVLAAGALTLDSLRARRHGTLQWKGRALPATSRRRRE